VCGPSPNGAAKTATVPRLLTKRTYFPVLLIALAFPAAALAAGSDGDRPKAGVADARVAQLAPLHRPVARFHHVIAVVTERIRTEQRAIQRRKRRELFANLPGGVTIETLESIAACESGGDPTAVSSDGSYRGKYQFHPSTWEAVGGSGDPAAAPEAEQDYRAALLYAQSGSSPWPICG
jgi:Transglycosylase-like domain